MHLSYICKKCGTSDQEAGDCPNCKGEIVMVLWKEYEAIKYDFNLVKTMVVGYKNPLDD